MCTVWFFPYVFLYISPYVQFSPLTLSLKIFAINDFDKSHASNDLHSLLGMPNLLLEMLSQHKKGVGGTRALAHSITISILLEVCGFLPFISLRIIPASNCQIFSRVIWYMIQTLQSHCWDMKKNQPNPRVSPSAEIRNQQKTNQNVPQNCSCNGMRVGIASWGTWQTLRNQKIYSHCISTLLKRVSAVNRLSRGFQKNIRIKKNKQWGSKKQR